MEAQSVLQALDLLDRWRQFGDPVVVGSVALDLVVRADIDLEIYSAAPAAGEGFVVASALAGLPKVREIRYRDSRDKREDGLYWKVYYELAPARTWTVDMWFFAERRRRTGAASMIPSIRAALDDEKRDTILAIKEQAIEAGSRAHGHWLYRAVLDDGIRSYPDYLAWIGKQDVWERTTWVSASG
ncbi:hypothetical protein C1I92_27760 [Jiangella anatolica]|uniref:Uncharacterized protein n=2 Tax=Jiangella anatolica TaxID=2670374 RepID=A0A2W2B258_9ACTN|nr:hypothetical protein C1I92_27760 [Jiangella anatolica]